MRPDLDTVALLREALEAAERGELQDVFLLSRDDAGEWDSSYNTDDLPDLLYELGTVILTERSASPTPCPH